MKKQLLTVAVWLLLLAGINISAQSNGPEFLSCDTIPLSLCVADDGVRLPLNNKLYLGENHPDASSCSVHVTQTIKVHSTCGKNLQYEVQIFLSDTSQPFILQPLTTIATDSLSEAVLSFDSELSTDGFISLNGIPYTAGCDPYHRIKWIVTDSCGNSTVCESRMHLFDCHSPTHDIPVYPYVIRSGFAGPVTMTEDTFHFVFKDDCANPNQVLMSFREDQYVSDTTFFICDAPALGVEVPWSIWIADAGRDLNCNGIIEWEERNIIEDTVILVFIDNCGGCECGKVLKHVFGEIFTEDFEPVAKVGVTISSPGQFYPTFITAQDGKYSIGYPNVILPENFTISVERNDNHINGVSTLDMVRIKKHLLGIEALSSPYDLIAADANNSENVSAIDLVEFRKLILGIYSELPNNKSWRFFAKDSIFSDPSHPWPLDEEVKVTNFQSDIWINFVAVKIGDVNNTVNPDVQNIAPRNNYPILNFKSLGRNYKSNEWIDIPISINEEIFIHGFQFTVSSDGLEFLGAFSDQINLSEENYALFDDNITFSWYEEDGKQFSKDDILFTLKARAKSDGNLNQTLSINSEITEAEVYSTGDEIYLPVLTFAEDNSTILFSPQPNPWKENTSIPFYLVKPGDASFEIYDANGRILFASKEYYSAGHYSIDIRASDLSSRGLLFYSITSDNINSTRKMILLD